MYNFFHGELVYEHDSVASTIYFIHTGVVKIYSQTNGFSFETYTKGTTFGDAEVFTNIKRIGTARVFTA
jgi:CRP-like cAMP-binding protein